MDMVEIKQNILNLNNRLQTIEKMILKKVSMPDLARELDISRQTLSHHIKANFKPQVDYYKENNKIYVDVSILPSIRMHYGK